MSTLNLNTSERTRKLVVTALLSAIGFVLMLLEFPLPLTPTFIRMDLSDIPALIAAFAVGPLAGVTTELLKNVLHLIVGSTGGIGELANFIVGTAMVLPAGIIYRRNKTRKTAIIGCLSGSLSMGVFAALANYFILLPLFSMFMPIDEIIAAFENIMPFIQTKFDIVAYNVLPFNILKGLVISAVTVIIYKKLSPILKGGR
jgi:riboflavin transporter FmnP